MQHVVDDRVLVDAVRHGPTELHVLEPLELLRGNVGGTGFGVGSWVHVESQERGSESWTALVDREVAFILQRLKVGELLA